MIWVVSGIEAFEICTWGTRSFGDNSTHKEYPSDSALCINFIRASVTSINKAVGVLRVPAVTSSLQELDVCSPSSSNKYRNNKFCNLRMLAKMLKACHLYALVSFPFQR